MRGSQNAKAMAKTLRQELKDRTIDIGHSECLEIVARQLGYRNWNTVSASLGESEVSDLKPLPEGWEVVAAHKSLYTVSLKLEEGPDGQSAIQIQGKYRLLSEDNLSWLAIRQYFSAEDYRGRNIRFTVSMRCENVAEAAFPWLRVDNTLGQKLSYIGHSDLPVKDILSETQGWRRYDLIVAVPDHAHTIEFGVTLLRAVGTVWAANMEFVETAEAVTRLRHIEMRSPQNLSLTAV